MNLIVEVATVAVTLLLDILWFLPTIKTSLAHPYEQTRAELTEVKRELMKYVLDGPELLLTTALPEFNLTPDGRMYQTPRGPISNLSSIAFLVKNTGTRAAHGVRITFDPITEDTYIEKKGPFDVPKGDYALLITNDFNRVVGGEPFKFYFGHFFIAAYAQKHGITIREMKQTSFSMMATVTYTDRALENRYETRQRLRFTGNAHSWEFDFELMGYKVTDKHGTLIFETRSPAEEEKEVIESGPALPQIAAPRARAF